jgi:hypothetical protein
MRNLCSGIGVEIIGWETDHALSTSLRFRLPQSINTASSISLISRGDHRCKKRRREFGVFLGTAALLFAAQIRMNECQIKRDGKFLEGKRVSQGGGSLMDRPRRSLISS